MNTTVPAQYWNKKQVDINIFGALRRGDHAVLAVRSGVDHVPHPHRVRWATFEVGWNRTLSATDKQYIAALYPAEEKSAVPIAVDAEPMPASIGRYGEVDAFFFIVTRPETYEIETEGRTDVVASLFGPDDDTRPIAQDDNSGRRKNARIVVALTPGAYTVRVRHFSAIGLGDYAISVRRAT